MATLAVMKARIASELDRSDITSSIASAIQDAIDEFEPTRFWFNESRALTFATVAAQRIYTSADASWISNIIAVDAMFVIQSSQNYDLSRVDAPTNEYMSDINAQSGRPYEWAYYEKEIWLYPIPDAVYTVRALGHFRPADLSGDSDTNVWTTEAERLIRRRAKQVLFQEVVNSPEEAAMQEPLVQQELSRLLSETTRRRSMKRIQATQF